MAPTRGRPSEWTGLRPRFPAAGKPPGLPGSSHAPRRSSAGGHPVGGGAAPLPRPPPPAPTAAPCGTGRGRASPRRRPVPPRSLSSPPIVGDTGAPAPGAERTTASWGEAQGWTVPSPQDGEEPSAASWRDGGGVGGARRTGPPPQVHRRVERAGGREAEGERDAIPSRRRTQWRRRPGRGGLAVPTTRSPISPGMKAGEKPPGPRPPLPQRRPAPYHGVGGARRAAERGAAAAAPLRCWARRGLRQQEGKRRGRESGGNA